MRYIVLWGEKMKIRLTIWNEFVHERRDVKSAALYPDGMHAAIGRYLGKNPDLEITYATLDQPEHGLTDEVLGNTDVLIWWGHCRQQEVSDEVAQRVYERVLGGMGFIALHSARASKAFMKLMGTSCSLKVKNIGETQTIWVVNPSHPIAEGLGESFDIEQEDMFGEYFDIPQPDALVFIGWFKTGEAFRSGCCFHKGAGKIFYFQPGHQESPTFHNLNVLKVIENAVRWCSPA